MTKHLTRLIALCAFVTLTAGSVFGQSATTTTTLSTAITNTTTTTFVVASATGITAGSTWLLVDQEVVFVRALSGTSASVVRSTRPATHLAGAYVVVLPQTATVPIDPAGSCTSTNSPYLPVVSLATASVWYCNNGIWQGTDQDRISALIGFTNVGPSAYTAKVTDQIILVTSAVAPGIAVTLPSASTFPIGKVLVIKDGAGLLTTTNVITVTGTANQLDGNAATLLVSTAYSFIKLVNTGTSWLKIW